jgi:hypothetical protein
MQIYKTHAILQPTLERQYCKRLNLFFELSSIRPELSINGPKIAITLW